MNASSLVSQRYHAALGLRAPTLAAADDDAVIRQKRHAIVVAGDREKTVVARPIRRIVPGGPADARSTEAR
ncbi:MAG TPA: hypothetical protein VGU22_04785 [Methylomirabilota bacterium]|jgi:hypothetical protein|nr:hypothetical protein [Methylomirabilota bacterium]